MEEGMATVEGGDLLVKIWTSVQRLEQRLERVEQRLERLEQRVEAGFAEVRRRIDNTNDTLTLLGGVLHRTIETVSGRVDDFDRRLGVLEADPR